MEKIDIELNDKICRFHTLGISRISILVQYVARLKEIVLHTSDSNVLCQLSAEMSEIEEAILQKDIRVLIETMEFIKSYSDNYVYKSAELEYISDLISKKEIRGR